MLARSAVFTYVNEPIGQGIWGTLCVYTIHIRYTYYADSLDKFWIESTTTRRLSISSTNFRIFVVVLFYRICQEPLLLPCVHGCARPIGIVLDSVMGRTLDPREDLCKGIGDEVDYWETNFELKRLEGRR